MQSTAATRPVATQVAGGSAALTGHHAVGLVDAVDASQGGEEAVEVAGVGQLELEAHLRHPVGAGVGGGAEDVDVVVAHRGGHVPQQPAAVEGLHLDGGHERAVVRLVPVDVDQAVALAVGQRHGVGAVGAVHRDTAAPRDEAEDLVARHGRAAARQAHHQVVEALHVHTSGRAVLGARAPRLAGRRGEGLVLDVVGVDLPQVPGDAGGDGLARHVALPHRGEQGVEVDVVQLLGDVVEQRAVGQLLHREALPAHGLDQLLSPVLHRVLTALPREPLADLGGGSGRGHDLRPVERRPGALHLRREDLHSVAGGQLRVEGHQAAVDPRPDAGVAHLGVDRVGEVDRRGPGGEGDDLALGREDEDLVLLEVDLQVVHELVGIRRLQLPVDDPVEPGDVGHRAGVAVLVLPVGGHALLGAGVHLVGADLHLEGLALRPHHRRVQRLVEVELRHGHVVLEAPLHGLPGGVDRAERGVAVLHRVDDHPDADEVEDVVELAALHDHLLVDGVEVLRPAGDLGVDAQLGQALADLLEHLGEVEVALGAAHGHHVVDLGVALGVERGEREVLELLAHLLHAEAVGQGGVDVDRLAGRALLLPRRHRRDRAHVVEPVGQLDDEDPQVLGHRHEHLAHRGRLLGLLGVELDPVELRDPVDDRGDVAPEVLLEVLDRDPGVLHRVVEEGGGHRDVVEPEVGHDPGHGQRVLDVGLPRPAGLAPVGLGRQEVGPGDEGGGRLGVPGPEGGQQRGDLVCRRALVAPPGQDPIDRGHASGYRRPVATPGGRAPSQRFGAPAAAAG